MHCHKQGHTIDRCWELTGRPNRAKPSTHENPGIHNPNHTNPIKGVVRKNSFDPLHAPRKRKTTCEERKNQPIAGHLCHFWHTWKEMNAPKWKVWVVRDGVTLLVDPQQLGTTQQQEQSQNKRRSRLAKILCPKNDQRGHNRRRSCKDGNTNPM